MREGKTLLEIALRGSELLIDGELEQQDFVSI